MVLDDNEGPTKGRDGWQGSTSACTQREIADYIRAQIKELVKMAVQAELFDLAVTLLPACEQGRIEMTRLSGGSGDGDKH